MDDGRHALEGPGFRVEIDAAAGTIASWRAADGFEYARRARRGLGDWRALVRFGAGEPWTSVASHESARDVRAASGRVLASWRAAALLGARLEHRIETTPFPSHVLELSVSNAADRALEIGDLAMPFPVNDDFRRGTAGGRVFLHPFVAGHGSFFRVAREKGDGPDLLAISGPGTAPEEFARSPYPDESPAERLFPGVSEVFLFSAAARERLASDGPMGHAALRLEPGESRAFSFRFFLSGSDSERERALVAAGKLSIRIVPGLVLPRDVEAKVRIATDVAIRSMETLDGGTVIDTVGKREKGQIFRVRVEGSGRRRIRIRYGSDEWTQVTFLAVPPLRDLVAARARFVAENQRCCDPDDPRGRRGAFLPYDAARGAIHADDDRRDLVSGRGAIGVSEPLFLAMKNAAFPEPHEIDVLGDFVRTHVAPCVDAGTLAGEWGVQAARIAEILSLLADVKRSTGLPADMEETRLESLAGESARFAARAAAGRAETVRREAAPYDPEAFGPGDAAAARAARSDAPSFERFGCDRRWWDFPEKGAIREADETGLSRSSPLGAAVLLGPGSEGRAVPGPGDRALDVAFGGLLAPFGNVEESGVAHAGYRSEPSRRGFDALSGDASLGLVRALRSMESVAVDDPQYGPLGYGCVLERRFDDWRVIPRDGMAKRVAIRPLGLRVRITNGELSEVLAFESRSNLVLTLFNERESLATTRLEVTGLAAGVYDLAAPGVTKRTAAVAAEGGPLVVPEFPLAVGKRRVEIARRG